MSHERDDQEATQFSAAAMADDTATVETVTVKVTGSPYGFDYASGRLGLLEQKKKAAARGGKSYGAKKNSDKEDDNP